MPLPSRVSDLTGFDLLLSVTRTGSIGRAARLRPVWTAGRRLTGPARDLYAIAARPARRARA